MPQSPRTSSYNSNTSKGSRGCGWRQLAGPHHDWTSRGADLPPLALCAAGRWGPSQQPCQSCGPTPCPLVAILPRAGPFQPPRCSRPPGTEAGVWGAAPVSQPHAWWAWVGAGHPGSVVPAPGPSPQPGVLRREAEVLRQPKTPAPACPLGGVLRVLPSSPLPHRACFLRSPQLPPGLREVQGQWGEEPDKTSTGGSGTTPSAQSLGSRKPGFLFLGFRLLAPPKGAWGPKPGAIRLVHRGGSQTFRTPPQPPPSCGCVGRWVGLLPTRSPDLPGGPRLGLRHRGSEWDKGQDFLRVQEVGQKTGGEGHALPGDLGPRRYAWCPLPPAVN